MKQKTRKLTYKIWIYLALFLTLIIALIWILQVSFLDIFYEYRTTRTVEKIAIKTNYYYEKQKDTTDLDKLAYENNACIEIERDSEIIYSSNKSRGCLVSESSVSYKLDFTISNKKTMTYKLINPVLNNKTLINAIKLDDNTYAYINLSLEPTDPAINVIRDELIFITIIIYLSSFILAYFISKRISTPILKINKLAKRMAKGDFDTPIVVNENIEEIKELSSTLNQTRKELSKINETRKDLLANVSHDLKTPLTMIQAYAEMARDLNKDNEEKRTENLNIIIEESERLNELVNNILELSKSEANMDTLNKEKFNLTQEIKIILDRFNYLREKEGYNFIFNVNNEYVVKADKNKIDQVIYNLLINAINYTGDDKKVTVDIEENKKYLRVKITDTGKGIKKEDIDKIWNKYYKNEKNHKRTKLGTGLGLSIVKNILIKHDFKYGVISKPGKGSTFYFDINI